MKLLTQGGLSPQALDIFLKLTRIQSNDVKDALDFYLVKGYSEASSASLNQMSLSNFRRALARLEETAKLVEGLVQIRINAYRAVSQNHVSDHLE